MLAPPASTATRSPLPSFSRVGDGGRDQQRIVPGQLGQRPRQFLQPGVVGEATVPDMRVGPEQQRDLSDFGFGRLRLCGLRLQRGVTDGGLGAGHHAGGQRIVPLAVLVA